MTRKSTLVASSIDPDVVTLCGRYVEKLDLFITEAESRVIKNDSSIDYARLIKRISYERVSWLISRSMIDLALLQFCYQRVAVDMAVAECAKVLRFPVCLTCF